MSSIFVAKGATTVGEVIDQQIEFLLGRMFAEKKIGPNTRQKEVDVRKAQRAAIREVKAILDDTYCGNGSKFSEVKVGPS